MYIVWKLPGTNSPRVALGIHERTPNVAWKAAKATTKIHLTERSPCRRYRWNFLKILLCVLGMSQNLLSQKLIKKIMSEQRRIANLFLDENLKFVIHK